LTQPPRREEGLTVLLVGAGAVANAWAPVLRALHWCHDFPLTDDGANSFLARLVYLLRWHVTYPSDDAKAQLHGFQELYREVCGRICSELRLAQRQGELTARPQFAGVVKRFLRRTSRFAIINTNWDTVVEEALTSQFQELHGSLVTAAHLHGSVWDGDALYLPSELVREPYRIADQQNVFGGAHLAAMEAIDRARYLVLYGLSLSPLDAELCQIVESGCHESDLAGVDVITPDHSLVAHRVNLLLDPRRTVRVHGYHPDDLESPTDYTVVRKPVGRAPMIDWR
jgi:hypothetical protein